MYVCIYVFSLFLYTQMSSTRARRSTVKQVNYAKEQEFSDEDLFEEEEEETPAVAQRAAATPQRKPRGRQPRAAAVEADTTDDAAGQPMYKQVYTEKGYDTSLPPIRERFHFLPEYEEDGSPKIELIVGRRPVEGAEEQTNADGGTTTTTTDVNQEETPPKSRRKTRGKASSKSAAADADAHNSSSNVVEYEYLIKYKGRSYLHLEYKSGADLESMNKSAKGIYRRYLKKLAQGLDNHDELESTEFDPSYVVPEKIVDEKEQEIQVELTDKELLKWEKQREKEIAEEEAKGNDDEEEDDDNDEAKDKDDAKDSANGAKAGEPKKHKPGT